MRVFKKFTAYLSVVSLTVAACAAPFTNLTVLAKQAKSIHYFSDQAENTVITPEDSDLSDEHSSSERSETDETTANLDTESSETDDNDLSGEEPSSALDVPDETTETPSSEMEEPDSPQSGNVLDHIQDDESPVVTTYEELEEAIMYSYRADTITIANDIDFGSNEPITIYQNVTLRAESTVTLTAAVNRHFSVMPRQNSPTINFENIILEGNNSGGGIVVENRPPARASDTGGFAIINNLTIQNCNAIQGGAIELVKPVSLYYSYAITVKNAEITNNSARNGGGIYIGESNELYIEDSIIKNNTAQENGGGIYADSSWDDGDESIAPSSLQLSGNVQIDTNTAGDNGGGIFTNFHVPLELSGADIEIKNNEANIGGGIYFSGKTYIEDEDNTGDVSKYDDVPFTLSHLTVSHNKTLTPPVDEDDDQGSGGGVFIGKGYGTAYITNCKIHANNAAGHGGGVYAASSISADGPETGPAPQDKIFETLVIDSSNIFSNKADERGGGIASRADLHSSNSFYYDNRSEASGGAICIYGKLLIDNCQIYENHAEILGGAIDGQNADTALTHTIKNSNINKNTALEYGGGIHIVNSLEIADTFIENNSAEDHGGGICLTRGSLSISNSTISNNTSVAGGAIYMYHVGDLTIDLSTIANNKATLNEYDFRGNAGGIFYDGEGNINITQTRLTENTAAAEGGAVYIYPNENCTYSFEDCMISENKASDGGAIFLDLPDTTAPGYDPNENPLKLIHTNKVTFKDNRAATGYQSNLAADGLLPTHQANIIATTYSGLFENAYNNYDIVYNKGEEVDYVAVLYHGNGHTSGSEPASLSVKAASNVTISGSGSLAKAGHHFSRWNTKADGTGTSYSVNQTVTLNEDMHLYAIWTQSGGPGPGTTATDDPGTSTGGPGGSTGDPGGSTVEPSGSTQEPIDPTEDINSTDDIDDYPYGPGGNDSDGSGNGSGNLSSDTPIRDNWWKRNPKTGAAYPGLLTGELLLALSGLCICIKSSKKKRS